VQDGPETVASIREVVTVGGGAGRWIDATEDDVQPRGEEVGVVGADVELLSRKSLK
jgi:hypothetical protein